MSEQNGMTEKEREIDEPTDMVFLDTETTGLSPTDDRIVELAMIKVSDGRIVAEYSSLIDPEIHIPSDASAIHGIYDNDVAGYPTFGQIAQEVRDFLKGSVIIGHNISFDKGFLQEEFNRVNGIAMPRVSSICTYQMACEFTGYRKGNKLVDLTERYDIPHDDAHRAIDDVRATIHVWTILETKLSGGSFDAREAFAEALEQTGKTSSFDEVFYEDSYSDLVSSGDDASTTFIAAIIICVTLIGLWIAISWLMG